MGWKQASAANVTQLADASQPVGRSMADVVNVIDKLISSLWKQEHQTSEKATDTSYTLYSSRTHRS